MEKTQARWTFDKIAIQIASSEHRPDGPTAQEAAMARVIANHARQMEEDGRSEDEILAFIEGEIRAYSTLEG